MIIALDYDNTFTLDPDFWHDFIKKAQEKNHEVLIVTSRWPAKEAHVCEIITNTFPELTIHFTCKRPKKQVMKELGITINVWIDDSPESILLGDGR